MYEHRRHPILPRPLFMRRAALHFLLGGIVVIFVVGAGTAGYHTWARLPWIDSFLNAAMILSGMGPVDRMETSAAKLFAALYALFSGLVFIGVSGVILLPWIHRLFHWIHLDESESPD